MGRLERYVFRQAFSAFALCLAALTAVVWMTQALRELDLVTMKGQALSVFLLLTGLLIPTLVLAIAPIALFVAVIYTLNRLNADSELVVMAASGVSRARIARPFVALAALVGLFCGFVSLIVAPASLGALRLLVTEVRADIISTVVRDGRFTELEKGLTFHVREKTADGALLGLLVNDERNPKRIMTYLAEHGQVTELPRGTFLIMQNGAIQQQDNGRRDATIIAFQSYAVDLSQFASGDDEVFFKPRERSTWAILNPDPASPLTARVAGKLRGELHDRLSAPLYPVVFALLALAFLGDARTTRQGRSSALIAAGLAVVALRGVGFGISSMVVQDASAVPLVYLTPLAAVGGAFLLARRGGAQALTAPLERALAALASRGSGLGRRGPGLQAAE